MQLSHNFTTRASKNVCAIFTPRRRHRAAKPPRRAARAPRGAARAPNRACSASYCCYTRHHRPATRRHRPANPRDAPTARAPQSPPASPSAIAARVTVRPPRDRRARPPHFVTYQHTSACDSCSTAQIIVSRIACNRVTPVTSSDTREIPRRKSATARPKAAYTINVVSRRVSPPSPRKIRRRRRPPPPTAAAARRHTGSAGSVDIAPARRPVLRFARQTTARQTTSGPPPSAPSASLALPPPPPKRPPPKQQNG